MAIRAIVFDIGGVLEVTPPKSVFGKWEEQLKFESGHLTQSLHNVWAAGSIGTMSEQEVHRNIAEILQLSHEQVSLFMEDVWTEYLGTLNVELTPYFRNLRPAYKTALLSNSFVGAREREQTLYAFGDICDFIIYSHEVGLQKPDLAIYELTCKRLEVPANEVIFLDDRENFVDGAREFGMHAILFKDNQQAIAAIESCLKLQ